MSHCHPANRRFGATEKAIEVSHRGMKSRADTNRRRRRDRTRRSVSSAPSAWPVRPERDLGGVARGGYLLDEPLDRDVGGQHGRGALGGVIDPRLDPLEQVEPALDPGGAGAAGHAR
jgi:hypothetical protein